MRGVEFDPHAEVKVFGCENIAKGLEVGKRIAVRKDPRAVLRIKVIKNNFFSKLWSKLWGYDVGREALVTIRKHAGKGDLDKDLATRSRVNWTSTIKKRQKSLNKRTASSFFRVFGSMAKVKAAEKEVLDLGTVLSQRESTSVRKLREKESGKKKVKRHFFAAAKDLPPDLPPAPSPPTNRDLCEKFGVKFDESGEVNRKKLAKRFEKQEFTDEELEGLDQGYLEKLEHFFDGCILKEGGRTDTESIKMKNYVRIQKALEAWEIPDLSSAASVAVATTVPITTKDVCESIGILRGTTAEDITDYVSKHELDAGVLDRLDRGVLEELEWIVGNKIFENPNYSQFKQELFKEYNGVDYDNIDSIETKNYLRICEALQEKDTEDV